MSAHDPDAGFERLWPTVILRREVPGHQAPNAALCALIESLEQDNPDLTTDYRGGDFLNLEN